MTIRHARSEREIAAARRLFREYEAFLGIDLDFQGFADELADLPGRYARPDGALLLAVEGGRAAGCVAVRRLGPAGEGVCEMKRLFVRPAFRGRGLGRRLAVRVVAEAVRLGYAVMRLDTLDRLHAAMALYASMGFVRIPAYYDNPLPGVVYWELVLSR